MLLHSCCGPCSSSVIERLKNYFDITVLYYNPNIEPKEEYEKRKREQIRLLRILGVSYYDIDYLNEEYHDAVKGYENESENGARCTLCFNLRLKKTAKIAKEKCNDLKKSAEELVELAKDKGTPILEEAALGVKEQAIKVTKSVLNKLEETK